MGEMRRMLGVGVSVCGREGGWWVGTWRLVEARKPLSWARSQRTCIASVELAEVPFSSEFLYGRELDRGQVSE